MRGPFEKIRQSVQTGADAVRDAAHSTGTLTIAALAIAAAALLLAGLALMMTFGMRRRTAPA